MSSNLADRWAAAPPWGRVSVPAVELRVGRCRRGSAGPSHSNLYAAVGDHLVGRAALRGPALTRKDGRPHAFGGDGRRTGPRVSRRAEYGLGSLRGRSLF